jgi:hypothetical protein
MQPCNQLPHVCVCVLGVLRGLSAFGQILFVLQLMLVSLGMNTSTAAAAVTAQASLSIGCAPAAL